jgi:hypothetical protein
LWVIDFTEKGTPERPAASARASSSARTTTPPGEVNDPVSSKSRPEARFTPSRLTSDAVNERGVSPVPPDRPSAVVNVPSMPHQPAERNPIRARSRSTTIRVATLWTRPADSRGMIFFHRTGDTS